MKRGQTETESRGPGKAPHNGGRSECLRYNRGRACSLKESASGDLISIFSTVLVGKKCSRLEGAKRKIDLSLRIVTYAGFRFSSSKGSKAHLENHSKVTFYLTYPSFHTNF